MATGAAPSGSKSSHGSSSAPAPRKPPAGGYATRASPVGGYATQICAAVDKVHAIKGIGVSYVSPNRCEILRPSTGTFQTQAVIMPAQTRGEPAHELRDRLVSVGVDCGMAAVSVSVAAGACSAAPATGGLALLPCALALGPAVTGTTSCLISADKFINYKAFPQINEWMEHSPNWQTFEDGLNVADIVVNVPDVVNLRNLKSLRSAMAEVKEVRIARQTMKNSTAMWRNLLERMPKRIEEFRGELKESLSNRKLRAYLNGLGVMPRFNQTQAIKFLQNEMKALGIKGVIAMEGDYDNLADISARQHASAEQQGRQTSWPDAPNLKKEAGNALWDAGEAAWNSMQRTPDLGPTIWIMQQAKP